MGLFDYISEMLSIGEVHAEAQPEKEEERSEDAEEKSEDGDEEEAGEEEEEEEDEEPVDPKPALEEECAESKECAPYKHHYDECVERVTKKQEENDGKSDEDCVEEFFHLAHCATNCAAPKLFKMLK
ncbi:uncharacterized protein PV09_06291 [Verruconis gallopava]|uniref:Cytochrome b-c1 complex subunit 6, mitochondrial n=1 Tax=Verruconis gallopava TaxID=253628 RepID=A0A0D2A6Y7_9PEZI|nr:uncharacterized protein PV09_06291 [Verruconis gallopava]KIW02488.1 hypothetical protein PV09_06291 [Verruconis gallopava]